MTLAYRRMIQPVLSYGFLAFGAAWLLWTAADIRYLQGWYEAQGVDRFHYPYGEVAAGAAALVVAAFLLVRMNKLLVAVPIVTMVLLVTELYWLGYTR